MTEINKPNLNKPNKTDFVNNWTQGVFRIQVIAGLSQGDNKHTGTMIPAVHDIGLHAGEAAKQALTGHGYAVQEIVIIKPVPKRIPGQMEIMPVGALDQYEDGSLSYTTEIPLDEAQRTAAVSDPTVQALTRSVETRQFSVQLFTPRSFDEVVKSLKPGEKRAA